MTWQPGQPVVTAPDVAVWQAWRKASKLEQQRARRRSLRRIDYYPGKDAQAVIDRYAEDYSTIIDALALASADQFPQP